MDPLQPRRAVVPGQGPLLSWPCLCCWSWDLASSDGEHPLITGSVLVAVVLQGAVLGKEPGWSVSTSQRSDVPVLSVVTQVKNMALARRQRSGRAGVG